MVGSRWADNEEDAALDEQRKREKEAKKKAKAEKARRAEEAAKQQEEQAKLLAEQPPTKRAKLDHVDNGAVSQDEKPKPEVRPRRYEAPTWDHCGSVEQFEILNKIAEGSYGWVTRARSIENGVVVALKKLKMDGSEHSGFPITALREVQLLQISNHANILKLNEIVYGDTLNDVYMVLEFIEHDLKTLMEEMSEPFLASERKQVMLQLTSALDYLHDNWILHRDLKTSNILMNNRGILKIADFGMARKFSNPPPLDLTVLVVTLWYRAPEVLLGTPQYDGAIDVWSLGCIFAELVTNNTLLPGSNEVDQLAKTFELCGNPTDDSWPGWKKLPNAKGLRLSRDKGSSIRAKFPTLTRAGCALLEDMLELDPRRRPTAKEVLSYPYFTEDPRPKKPESMPTFPSKALGERRRRAASPNAPKRGEAPAVGADGFSGIFNARQAEAKGAGFQLRVG